MSAGVQLPCDTLRKCFKYVSENILINNTGFLAPFTRIPDVLITAIKATVAHIMKMSASDNGPQRDRMHLRCLIQVHAKLKQIIESLSGIIMAQSSQNFVGQKEVRLLQIKPRLEQRIVF